MRLPPILILLAGLSSGCSLVLDTDDFRGVEASGADSGARDAGSADGGGSDAGVAPRVDRVAPEGLLEGLGASGPEVRGTAVFVEGQGLFVEDVRSDDLEVRGFRASADGRAVGVAVAVPVDRELGAGQRKTARLLLQVGGATVPVEVDVIGLDEGVVRAGDAPPAGASPPAYSELVFEGGRFDGLTEVRWLATARLEVRGTVRVDGLSDRTAGPGGCRGGAAEQAGACDPRAGRAGAAMAGVRPTGGGGAGNREPGAVGGAFAEGLSGGAPGTATVGYALVSGLRTQAGAGGGGGGGAGSGVGGGGGGAIALVSRGLLLLGDVDARGGPGQPLSGDCSLAGGGGGSGGVVLLRGWRTEGAGTVDVRGGASGGAPACDNRGGAGGSGFAYIQTSSGSAGLAVEPAGARIDAIAWADDTPVIVGTTARLEVRGAGRYHVQVEGGESASSIVPAGGVGGIDLDLGAAGLKQVCLRRTAGAVDALEGRDCLAFAIVP